MSCVCAKRKKKGKKIAAAPLFATRTPGTVVLRRMAGRVFLLYHPAFSRKKKTMLPKTLLCPVVRRKGSVHDKDKRKVNSDRLASFPRRPNPCNQNPRISFSSGSLNLTMMQIHGFAPHTSGRRRFHHTLSPDRIKLIVTADRHLSRCAQFHFG